jgi:hypothetical protein
MSTIIRGAMSEERTAVPREIRGIQSHKLSLMQFPPPGMLIPAIPETQAYKESSGFS